jgi:hypothetical protein
MPWERQRENPDTTAHRRSPLTILATIRLDSFPISESAGR